MPCQRLVRGLSMVKLCRQDRMPRPRPLNLPLPRGQIDPGIDNRDDLEMLDHVYSNVLSTLAISRTNISSNLTSALRPLCLCLHQLFATKPPEGETPCCSIPGDLTGRHKLATRLRKLAPLECPQRPVCRSTEYVLRSRGPTCLARMFLLYPCLLPIMRPVPLWRSGDRKCSQNTQISGRTSQAIPANRRP